MATFTLQRFNFSARQRGGVDLPVDVATEIKKRYDFAYTVEGHSYLGELIESVAVEVDKDTTEQASYVAALAAVTAKLEAQADGPHTVQVAS